MNIKIPHPKSFTSNVNAPIKVIIADDHPIFINGILGLINDTPDIILCASFSNVRSLLDWFNGSNADIILLDINMPLINGIELGKQLINRFPVTKIIVFSMENDLQIISDLSRIGVYAYLLKGTDPEYFIQTIFKVYAGEKVFPERLFANSTNGFLKKDKYAITKLSEREMQILKLIVEGKTNKQIAHMLNVSPYTVKTHRQNLLHKQSANNTAQLIANARLNGLL